MDQDAHELELALFVRDVRNSSEELAARKTWLHSRWYKDDHYLRWLDAARSVGAAMTFCFLDRDVPFRKRIIDRMLEDGHEVATHGRLHYLIDDRFGYDRLLEELTPCVEELRALEATAEGLWLGRYGSLHGDASRALVDLGITWFSSVVDHDGAALADGVNFLQARWPHDVQILFYEPIPPAEALATWKRMYDEDRGGVFMFHPFTMTMLDDGNLGAFCEFMEYTGGSVSAAEKIRGSDLPSIVVDASLHLATGRPTGASPS